MKLSSILALLLTTAFACAAPAANNAAPYDADAGVEDDKVQGTHTDGQNKLGLLRGTLVIGCSDGVTAISSISDMTSLISRPLKRGTLSNLRVVGGVGYASFTRPATDARGSYYVAVRAHFPSSRSCRSLAFRER